MASSNTADKDLYLAACKGDTMALIGAKGRGANINSTVCVSFFFFFFFFFFVCLFVCYFVILFVC